MISGDIVRVPFPHVESDRIAVRPALVLATRIDTGIEPLFWALMITSAANRGWPDDVSLEERYGECGLRLPCIVRCAKITTLAMAQAGTIGRLPDDLFAVVRATVSRILALDNNA